MAEPVKGLDLSIVIPTFNKVRMTAQCFASIARNAGNLRYEIIVVDNGSTDETLSFVGSHTPGNLRGKAMGSNPPKLVTLLHNTAPRLLARSWNMGVDAAHGRHIMITNNDVLFGPGSIEAISWCADTAPAAGVVVPLGPKDVPGGGPTITAPDGSKHPIDVSVANMEAVERYWASHKPAGFVQFLPDPYLPQGGFCFLLTRRAWDAVGRFDEEYDLTAEDWDYFDRLRRHYKLVRAHDAFVAHFEHTTCENLGHEWHERLCRNRFRLTEKREHCYEHFSIVMPTYNRSDSLRLAIDSVIGQTFPHWRLYICDDGSTDWDAVRRVAKDYELAANRIWFFHRAENIGPGATRNWGMGLTRGKYVAFLDSDDIWYRDHLASHWNIHESSNVAMVYSDSDFAWRERDRIGRYVHHADQHPYIQYRGEWSPALLRERNYIQTSGVSVWGELARSIPMREDMRIEEDWEWFKAVADVGGVGCPVHHIDRPTCRYHIVRKPDEADHLTRQYVPAQQYSGARMLLDRPRSGQIGVVIPTRGRPCCIGNAIRSCGDVPVVVVDDGSIAGSETFDICERFENVTLLRVDQPGGPSRARNHGIDCFETEWIQFLDDDDVLTADWLLRLSPHLATMADLVVAAGYCPGHGGLVIDREVYTSQICARAAALRDVGGFAPSLSWAEDRDLVQRMTNIGKQMVSEPLPTCVRAVRGGTGEPRTAVTAAPPPARRGRWAGFR